MCAIAGYIAFEGIGELSSRVSRMLDLMFHRGPDNKKIEEFAKEANSSQVCLGHNRLSIIDLSSSAHQPMSNEDGSIWIVFNGEIYNFKELTESLKDKGHIFKSHSDTEAIIHLYEDYRQDCLRFLKGMFSFCIYDKRKEELFFVRDRFGKKPLYYYYDPKKFIFASEIKAFRALAEIEKEIEFAAIESYFTLGYIIAPYTIYKGIFKLLPGHYLTLSKKGIQIERYWEPKLGKMVPGSKEVDWLKKFSFLVEEAVKSRMISDVPLGAFLSGGVDSSLIVALMKKVTSTPVKTYSIGFNEQPHDELCYADYVSRYLKTEHRSLIIKDCSEPLLEKVVWHLDEPLADGATVPTYLLAKLAKEEVTVVLTGEGSDETLAGYPYYYYEKLIGYYVLLPEYLRRKLLPFLLPKIGKVFSTGILSKILKYGSQEPQRSSYRWRVLFEEKEKDLLFNVDVKNSISYFDTKKEMIKLFNSLEAVGIINKALYIDSITYLPDDLLMKIDKLTMAHSLEARCPYLDYDLTGLVNSMPQRLKMRGSTGKYILKEYAKDYIPQQIICRPKHGFTVPIENWLRTGLNGLAQEAFLTAGILDKSGLFNAGYIEWLWHSFSSGKNDARKERQLWGLLNFAVWWRQNQNGY